MAPEGMSRTAKVTVRSCSAVVSPNQRRVKRPARRRRPALRPRRRDRGRGRWYRRPARRLPDCDDRPDSGRRGLRPLAGHRHRQPACNPFHPGRGRGPGVRMAAGSDRERGSAVSTPGSSCCSSPCCPSSPTHTAPGRSRPRSCCSASSTSPAAPPSTPPSAPALDVSSALAPPRRRSSAASPARPRSS